MKIYSVILMMVVSCLFIGCSSDDVTETPTTDTVEATDVTEDSDTTSDSRPDVVATEDDTVATESDDVSDDDSE